MFKHLLFVLFLFFFSLSSSGIESVYETNFFNINIENETISDAKNKKIDEIKTLTLKNIFKKILTKDNYNKVKRLEIYNDNINFFIKNIIIENEFISSNKYYADLKVNLDNKEIISFLRNNKINYTDFESPNILIIASEKNKIYQSALSKNNNFYKNVTLNKYGIINIIYPDLSLNDRFIAPYKKIINNDIKTLQKLTKKYQTNYILIINLDILNNTNKFDISIFSSLNNDIQFIESLFLDSNIVYQNEIFDLVDNWWKIKNQINNSQINKILCLINSSNIYEIKKINSKINSISQIKSNILNRIQYGKNYNELIFYGSLKNLSTKLLIDNINIIINKNNKCIIDIIN
tara:strand:- start:963 stop:2006 length:1044 start_codon:yes stop_codon:yes gene_type:complete